MKTFNKKYLLLTNNGVEGWSVEEYDNVSEAVLADHPSNDWLVVSPVSIAIRDAEDDF